MTASARYEERHIRLALETPTGRVSDVLCRTQIPPPGVEKPRLQFRSAAFHRLDQSGQPAPRFQQALGDLARSLRKV